MSQQQVPQSEHNPSGAGQQEAETRNNQTEARTATVIATAEAPPAGNHSDPTDKRKDQQRKDLHLLIESIGLTALIVYTVFSVLQWAQIRWTNRLTREALNGSDSSLKQTLGKMQEQTTQTSRLANASEAANNNARVSDRPWIGITISVADFEVGKTPVASLAFINSGRRPAKVIETKYAARNYTIFPLNPEYKSDELGFKSSISVMVPNGGIGAKMTIDPHWVSPELMAIFSDSHSTARFFVYARVRYVDLLDGSVHTTKECEVYRPKSMSNEAAFYFCDRYNDAD